MNFFSANAPSWYSSLVKPNFAPPAEIFGLVWGILYPIIFITFGIVFWLTTKKKIPRSVALPFTLNLIFNFAFSPIAFGLQNNLLATADIIFVLGTIIWLIIKIWPHSKVLASAQIPYFLWVSFATVLQISITILNF